MRSIKVFLVASIVSVLILFNFVAALQGYRSSMREAESLFDNEMIDFAWVIARLDISNQSTTKLRLGSDIAFQIWEDGQLLAASENAPTKKLHDFSYGFDYTNFGGYRWRTLAKLDPVEERWIFVAERTDLRYLLAENVVLHSVLPLLVGIPIVGFLVWVLVSKGLSPLSLLSLELKAKPADDLSPLNFTESRIELEQVLVSLNGFVSRLGSAMERERRFSADAAHELRTPISALKVQLHNLSQLSAVDQSAYRELQLGVDRMHHLIEQLLSLYRTSPEVFYTHRVAVDILELTQTVIARLYPEFEKKKQSIELEGVTEAGVAVLNGDQFSIETMLTNLLLNASRYTPKNGQIVVSIIPRDDKIQWVIEDSGIGIAECNRDKIFDRFTRLEEGKEQQDTPENTGCGLGLAIVNHVVALHKGRIAVDRSRFPTGAAFIVDFPLSDNFVSEGVGK